MLRDEFFSLTCSLGLGFSCGLRSGTEVLLDESVRLFEVLTTFNASGCGIPRGPVLAVSIENQSYWIRRIQQLSELLDIRAGR